MAMAYTLPQKIKIAQAAKQQAVNKGVYTQQPTEGTNINPQPLKQSAGAAQGAMNEISRLSNDKTYIGNYGKRRGGY